MESMPRMVDRSEQLNRLRNGKTTWDVLVIGGGAMGLGVALESLRRGYRTALVEQRDFAHGTSSRSTKLIHGGIRYLEQRDFRLVREALHERKSLCEQFPEAVRPIPFVIPTYSWSEHGYYRAGTWLYDRLAGRHNLSRSRSLSSSATQQAIPFLRPDRLMGGIEYSDAQFDDSRLAMAIATAIWQRDGIALNYVRVTEFESHQGRLLGALVEDQESFASFSIRANVIVNATGVGVDELRQWSDSRCEPRLRFSQGTHLVLDAKPEWQHAMLVPRTPDGRVVFIIPWLGKLLVGTTEVEVPTPEFEPIAMRAEVDYLLELAGRYLVTAPSTSDIRSVFAGHRALVLRPGAKTKTHQLSRTHLIEEDPSGLLSVLGGKWTTFAAVGRDVVNHLERFGRLTPATNASIPLTSPSLSHSVHRSETSPLLHARLPIREEDIDRAMAYEMARTVDDVLARRTRCLFLDAKATLEVAPQVASRIAAQRGFDAAWATKHAREFQDLARRYMISGVNTYGG